MQEFRTPYEMTLQAANTSTRTGNPWTFESMKAADEHKLSIERSLLFGERDKVIASSKNRFATRGLKKFISSGNQFNVGGPLSEYDFDDWVRAVFRDGTGDAVSDTKILLANDRLLGIINRYQKVRLQTKVGEKKYGVAFTDYLTPHGSLKLVHHRMLDKTHSNRGYGLLYDPANVRLRYFKGPIYDGRTKLFKDIKKDNNPTVRKDEYITTVGLEVKHTTTHGEILNVLG